MRVSTVEKNIVKVLDDIENYNSHIYKIEGIKRRNKSYYDSVQNFRLYSSISCLPSFCATTRKRYII